jgi:hypothetical protein
MQMIKRQEHEELYLYTKSALSMTRSKQVILTEDTVQVAARGALAIFKLSYTTNGPQPGQYAVDFLGENTAVFKPTEFNPLHTIDETIPTGPGWESTTLGPLPKPMLQTELFKRSEFLVSGPQLKPFFARCKGTPATLLYNKDKKRAIIISGALTLAFFAPADKNNKLLTGIRQSVIDRLKQISDTEGTSVNRLILDAVDVYLETRDRAQSGASVNLTKIVKP